MNKEEILQLKCPKHIKMYKLKQIGLRNSEIAALLITNQTYVCNTLKKYKDNTKLVERANGL